MVEWTKSPEVRLSRLLDDLFNGRELDADTREWLIKAFFHYLHYGGAEPLDKFLGLSPINAGERSLSTKLAHLKRDMLLSDAVDNIALDNSVTDWSKCVRLASELKFFSTNTWPIYRYRLDPLNYWPLWKQSLFQAFKVGLRVPGTAKSLYEIRKQVRAISFHSPNVKLLTSLTRIQENEKDLVLNQRAPK